MAARVDVSRWQQSGVAGGAGSRLRRLRGRLGRREIEGERGRRARFGPLSQRQWRDVADLEDPCWREATIVYWHRASLYLARTESLPILSTVDEPKLQELVAQEELLDEIRTLYAAGDCEAFDVTSGLAD